MKRKILGAIVAFGILVSLSGVAWAGWFSAHASTFVSPTRVTAKVINTSPTYAMQCQVQVFGVRSDGATANAWSSFVVPPGGYQFAYVYTTTYPFVNGYANTRCTYLTY